jgi:hypothetical protein
MTMSKSDRMERKIEVMDERIDTCLHALGTKGWSEEDVLVLMHTALEMPWDVRIETYQLTRAAWSECLKRANRTALEYIVDQKQRPGVGWARNLIAAVLVLRTINKADAVIPMVKDAKWATAG